LGVRVELGAGVCDAVRGSGDYWGVSAGIASRDLVVTLAREEHSGGISSWHVVVATFSVVDVLAIIRVRDRVIADFEAELVATNEVVPV